MKESGVPNFVGSPRPASCARHPRSGERIEVVLKLVGIGRHPHFDAVLVKVRRSAAGRINFQRGYFS